MKTWLETSEYFVFVEEIECKDVVFQLYLDDSGQSFTLAWIDPITNTIAQWCCGAYNDYHWDMEDIAVYVNKRKESINV